MQTVVKRQGDPFIYLFAQGQWYFYNPADRPIGSGAMGDVYVGYSCVGRNPIAVKRVKDSYAGNPMVRERARQEASLSYRHPNLVEMLGCCEYDRNKGPIFILSNFVRGKNVDEYIRYFENSPLRVEKACCVIYSVLDALDYIHSKGVVHRDIKPSNIMVENDNNVRLMDLGIARMNLPGKHTVSGFIGTPEYAAPEQIKQGDDAGADKHITAATDIYSLGITFYELLTGKNPMACDSEAECLRKQAKESLPNSSAIPKRLMKVILKATEKDPSLRYQKALDFKHAVMDAVTRKDPWFAKLFGGLRLDFLTVMSIVFLIAVIVFIIVIIMMWI